MRWSFRIARLVGIDVRVHVTFFLLLAWVWLSAHKQLGTAAALSGVVFVCLVFLCVLLHEFGHALAARRYGIRTPDITLLPIGGVARLEKIPDNPRQELVIAIAGPAVNVAIAALLLLITGFTTQVSDPDTLQVPTTALLPRLLTVNIWLVLFNLIPAFPMDGGRILRALLALRLPYARATQIAATVGQCVAFFFVLWGLNGGNPMLILIAVFVFFGAQSEAAFAEMKGLTNGLRVHSAMVTQFISLPITATLHDAAEALLRGSQHDFPVIDPGGAVRGVLTRDGLLQGLRRDAPEAPVLDFMRTDIPAVHHSMLFDRAVAVMQESGSPAVPVLDANGKLVGLFTPENVGELLMVQSALAASPRAQARARHLEPPSLPQPGIPPG